MASAARRPEGFLRSARGSPDWPSALISLSMSYSTRRIESVAPSIKRYDANLPTMICANRLAPAVLFSIGCAGLPAATHRCCDPCAAATSEISPSHSPTGSGRMTRKREVGSFSRAMSNAAGINNAWYVITDANAVPASAGMVLLAVVYKL